MTTEALIAAFVFAAVGGWNLWTALAWGTVVAHTSEVSRHDNPVMFWFGVVVYGVFVVAGTGVLVVGLLERVAT